MLIHWRKFNRARKGTIRYQGLIRGRNLRRTLAATKVQKYQRCYIRNKHYRMLKSAILALQCAQRSRVARAIFTELMKEQKDVGKLKGMNEKLKEEMSTLRAMLAAQGKERAASEEHTKALAEKQSRIEELEQRIAEIEKELAEAKEKVQQLEANLKRQQSETVRDKEQISSLQKGHRKSTSSENPIARRRPSNDATNIMPSIPSDYVSPEVLNTHRAKVAILEDELENERKLRREADGEIIRLRAAANGVKLDAEMVNDLLAPQSDTGKSEESSFADESPVKSRYVTRTIPTGVFCFGSQCSILVHPSLGTYFSSSSPSLWF